MNKAGKQKGKEGMAGKIAKAAAPKEKIEGNKQKHEKQRGKTEEEMDEFMANAMLQA